MVWIIAAVARDADAMRHTANAPRSCVLPSEQPMVSFVAFPSCRGRNDSNSAELRQKSSSRH